MTEPRDDETVQALLARPLTERDVQDRSRALDALVLLLHDLGMDLDGEPAVEATTPA